MRMYHFLWMYLPNIIFLLVDQLLVCQCLPNVPMVDQFNHKFMGPARVQIASPLKEWSLSLLKSCIVQHVEGIKMKT